MAAPNDTQSNVKQNDSLQIKIGKNSTISAKKLVLGIAGLIFFLLVTAALQYRNSRLQTRQDITILPNPVLENTNLDVESWKVYQNGEMQIKYPSTWISSENVATHFYSKPPSGSKPKIVFSDNCKGMFFAHPLKKDLVIVLDTWDYPYSSSQNCWLQSSSRRGPVLKRMALIDGNEYRKNAVQVEWVDSTVTYKEDHKFESELEDLKKYRLTVLFNPSNAEEAQAVFDKMASSFEFLVVYQVQEPKEWKTFTSERLGYSFQYPAFWGEISEEISDAPSENTGDSGKTYYLQFSKKSKITGSRGAFAVGQSEDYSAGRGSIPGDFRGFPEQPLGVSSRVLLGLVGFCRQGPGTIGFLHRGEIMFNLPGREISGVKVVVPIFSPDDVEKRWTISGDFVDSQGFCEKRSSDRDYSYDQWTIDNEYLEKEEKRMESEILTGKGLDEETQINIEIFKRIISSAKVL